MSHDDREPDDRAGRIAEVISEELDRRVPDMVSESIRKWERGRGAVALIILGILGFTTFTQVRDRIVDYFAKSVASNIDDQVRQKTANISIQDPVMAKLDTRVSELEKQVASLAKTPGPMSSAAVAQPSPRPDAPNPPSVEAPPTPIPTLTPAPPPLPSGFAFFGVRDPAGSWSERYFDFEDGAERAPRDGDALVVRNPVNVRSGYITYGPHGWTNQPVTGVLRQGERIRVTEAKEVIGGFWWISFVRLS